MPPGFITGFSFDESLKSRIGQSRMLIGIKLLRIAGLLWNGDRNQFVREESRRVGLRPALLRPQRERIPIFPRHLEILPTFSAVSGMESTPYLLFIRGLTKRQPMVVSKISA